MPSYNYSEEEYEWYQYCVRNNIRVSPKGINGDADHWKIDVSTDGTVWHTSPKKYNREEIWQAYFKVCQFYYNKLNKEKK